MKLISVYTKVYEFSSCLLGDQIPIAVSRTLWYEITAVGGVRLELAYEEVPILQI